MMRSNRWWILAVLVVALAAFSGSAQADQMPQSVYAEGRPVLSGTIWADGTNVHFDITAVGQADDGDNVNTSKYYTQSNFDNEYFTLEANGRYLKYNMFSGNTTPGWGTGWSSASDPLPAGVSFSQTVLGDDFVYEVVIPYATLGVADGDTFNVQVKARDFNDDFVQSYSGFNGFDGEYSQYRGLWITDTGVFQTTVSVPEPGTIALLGLGAGALALRRRKRQA
jgi:hypothetical protein